MQVINVEAYIDISYIFHLLLILSSLKFMKIISSYTLNKRKTFFFELTSLIVYINVLLFSNQSIMYNIFYCITLFVLFYKGKFIIPLISFIFAYYSQIAIVRIFTNGIYLYKWIIMIHTPLSFFYILICPILLLTVEIITRSINHNYPPI